MRRIDHLLSSLGYASRREARTWVADGRVTVGGVTATDSGARVDPSSVRVDGEPLDHPEGLLFLYHKPVGLVCSHDPQEGPRIYDQLPPRWLLRNPPLTSVGRLDKETSGLLLLTDVEGLVHTLTSPKKDMPKVYRVRVDAALPAHAASLFASGTLMLDSEAKPCLPAVLTPVSDTEALLQLTEGRYHQVRRMMAALGLTVVSLHRERFGDLTLEGLAPGQWKHLPVNYFSK